MVKRWITAGVLTVLFLITLSCFRSRAAKPWPDLVQAAVTVERLSWNPAAPPEPFASGPDIAWEMPEGAPALAITRLDRGWEVTATGEAAKALDEKAMSGPVDVIWAGADRALVRWQTDDQYWLVMADLRAGTVSELPPDQFPRVASPDGRFLVVQRGQSWALVDTIADRLPWQVPPRLYPSRWVGDRYIWLESDRHDYAADVANRVLWAVPKRSLVAAVAGQFCYSAGEATSPQLKDSVVCETSPQGNTATLLATTGHQTQQMQILLTDPTDRFLAFAYQGTPVVSAGLLPNGVAHATPPLPNLPVVDTVAVYDAAAGTVRRMHLPDAVLLDRLLWSPDGEHLGLQVHHEKGVSPEALDRGTLWSLEVASGRLQRIVDYDKTGKAWLLGVQKGGSLLAYHGGKLQLFPPGQDPTLWPPEGELLSWDGWWPTRGSNAVGWLVVALPERLDVHLPNGMVMDWPRPDGVTYGSVVVPHPDGTWAAVLNQARGKSGRLLFLQR